MQTSSLKSLSLHGHSHGSGYDLIILHGLLGSHKNWQQQARALADEFRVHTLDLRNHGNSPQAPTMSYAEMAADVLHWMQLHDIQQAHLLGHSMGGKVAMQIALTQAACLKKLIVVDIAPKTYPPHHDSVLAAMQTLDLANIRTRQTADIALRTAIPDQNMRQFILTNLTRSAHGQFFSWQPNLAAIAAEYPKLVAEPEMQNAFLGPTLFIKGGKSNYLEAADKIPIERRFPHARVKIIANAGHWPHAEKPAVFSKLVKDFLTSETV